MRLGAGGLGFALGPPGALSGVERAALRRLDPDLGREQAPARGADFQLELRGAPARADAAPSEAVVSADARRLRVAHRDFRAELDPGAGCGWLARTAGEPFPLTLTLRVAMAARLPVLGGVPLHAAGVLMGGGAVVFFGPSGAGKSTLSGLSSHPLLSDELVAVRPDPTQPDRFVAAATGVWGTLGARAHPSGCFPLRALVALDRAAAFVLERLTPATALRRLVGVAMVPAASWLWSPTLEALARLAQYAPAYRMSWSPAEPPFAALDAALPRAGAAGFAAAAPTARAR